MRVGALCSGGMELLTSRILVHPTDLGRSLRFCEHTLMLAIYRRWGWGTGQSRGVVLSLGGGGLLEVSGNSSEPLSGASGLALQVRERAAARAYLAEQGGEVEASPR